MSKKTEEQKIEIKSTDYKIIISIKDNKIHLEIVSSKNKNINYNEDYSLNDLKNNRIFQKYNNINEIYEFLKKIIKSNYNILKIEDFKKVLKLMIKIKEKQEIITFEISKKDEQPENKDDTIFKNNLNNFENILNDIENDMKTLDPFIMKLEEENKKITEENIKLKKEIKFLKEENQMLKQKLNNININNSKDNLIVSNKENNNLEKIKEKNEIKIIKKGNKILNKENNNSDNQEKIKEKNEIKFIKKETPKLNQENNNPDNQEKTNFEKENKNLNGNQKNKPKLKKSDSNKKIIDSILTKELENKITYFIKESKSYQNNIISFKRLYKASIDNDFASSFHNKVDNQGPIIVIIKIIDDKIIGGFTSKSWSSNNENVEDNEAFLFLISKFYSKKFIPKAKDKNNACYHNKDEGPHFGKNALIISNNCLTNNNNNICANDTYNFKDTNLLGKKISSNFKIKDYEVYQVIIN